MPEQLDDEAFARLLTEKDAFKLAIRGFTAIEAELDAYLKEAFVAELPGGMRGLGGFERRLAIAIALGIVPVSQKRIIKELASLRNDFAHGSISDLTPVRVRRLREAFSELLPDNEKAADLVKAVDQGGPHITLRVALMAGRSVVVSGGRLARALRAKQEQQASPIVVALLEAQLRSARETEITAGLIDREF